MSEEETSKMLETLTAKTDELSKAIKERKEFTEEKIRENPITYAAGAFAGGLILGFMMARGKN